MACIALVASACAGGATPASPTVSQIDRSTTTSAATVGPDETPQRTEPTEPQSPATSDAASERPAPDPGRPTAPDFSLELAGGSIFLLSRETRPVFMVFWAEW